MTLLDPAAGCSAGAAECFSFESGTVPASFVMSGNANWTIDSNAASGTRSLRSGAITDNQTTCFAYFTATTNSVAFSLEADSEAAWDKLEFYIDTVKQPGSWSGSIPWTRVIFGTTSGTHTFKWCYTKDSTNFTGLDAVWIDDIEFN